MFPAVFTNQVIVTNMLYTRRSEGIFSLSNHLKSESIYKYMYSILANNIISYFCFLVKCAAEADSVEVCTVGLNGTQHSQTSCQCVLKVWRP